jgi:hypothetical protein
VFAVGDRIRVLVTVPVVVGRAVVVVVVVVVVSVVVSGPVDDPHAERTHSAAINAIARTASARRLVVGDRLWSLAESRDAPLRAAADTGLPVPSTPKLAVPPAPMTSFLPYVLQRNRDTRSDR